MHGMSFLKTFHRNPSKTTKLNNCKHKSKLFSLSQTQTFKNV